MAILAPQPVPAAEEAVDLSQLETPAPPPPKESPHLFSKMKLMGRVDLTNEFLPYDPDHPRENNEFKNYHYFVFLKIKASERVSFIGEIISKAYFAVTYDFGKSSKINFGKILIPFGDNRRFHNLYGGIQNYGVVGVMLPNIWAEHGVNLETKLEQFHLDTYWVSGISGTSTTDPELNQPSSNGVQALGSRVTYSGFDHISLIGSAYFNEWMPGKKLLLYGLTATTEYGWLNAKGLRTLRFGLGFATADIQETSFGQMKKTGDYLEIVTNAVPSAELRLRYGTFIHNNRQQSQKDVHNLNFAVLSSLDVMRWLLEYQWNFEAINEVKNDVLRAMVSLDF